MSERITSSPQWLRWAFFGAGWTLLVLIFASQFYLSAQYGEHALSWGAAVLMASSVWYPWALFALLIHRLVQRFPFKRERWLRRALMYGMVGFVLALTKSILDMLLLNGLLAVSFVPAIPLRFQSTDALYVNLLIYAAVLAGSLALTFYDQYRARELMLSQLETQVVQAQLTALKMQLHPHFLFNTLHTIAILNHTDVEKANQVLVLLSDLLRRTLDTTHQQEVPLQDELDFLRRYLEIEHVRFAERLQVDLDIAPETLDAYVPSLILQPLVENAIRHGISQQTDVGRLQIGAQRSEQYLRLTIQDNGPGLSCAEPFATGGMGLRNVQARLTQLYDHDHTFTLQQATAGGVCVQIQLPFRLTGSSSRAPS